MLYPEFLFTSGAQLPVGTIYGIGKNYAAHAREMGGEVPASPMVFIKPPASFVNAAPSDNAQTPHLSLTNNLHYEVELVVVIGKDCQNLPKSEAASVIAGYGIGLDMTLRDLQSEAKTSGSPWAVAKGYAASAPCSRILPAAELPENPEFELELRVNDVIRQQASTRLMERDVATLIAYLSEVFTLRKGDCIFTGTPEGVGRVVVGDRINARLSHAAFSGLDLSVVVSA